MRNSVLALALVAAGVAAWLWLQNAPPAAVRVVAEAPRPEAPTPPKPTATEPPLPDPVAPPPLPINAGFCAPDDGPTSIEIRHTLRGLKRSITDAQLIAAVDRVLTTDDPLGRLEALRAARTKLPKDPALGWELAALTRNSPDLDEAIDGLNAYLAADPQPDLARLRALLEVQRDIQRGYLRVERGGTTVLWPDGVLTHVQADDLAYSINRSLDDAARLTGTPRRKTLTVVVYPSRSELLAVTCVRSWTAGVYDGTLRLVGTPSLEPKVVRHETLHAQLSKHALKAPRWFHEGLAQSFADQTERRGRWVVMVKNRVWVPFSSLDGSFQAFEASDDAALAYTQSYAMVELMRECGTDSAMPRAIEDFQKGTGVDDVLLRACGRPITGNDLLDFMAKRLTTP